MTEKQPQSPSDFLTTIRETWVDYMEPSETPFTAMLPKLPATPDFCFATRKTPVEPYHSIYQDLWEVIDMVLPDIEGDNEWGGWKPSPATVRLQDITLAIGRKSYAEVENPGYDAEKCLAWKEENMKHFTKVKWGLAPMTHIEDTVIITPDGPRVIDQEEEA